MHSDKDSTARYLEFADSSVVPFRLLTVSVPRHVFVEFLLRNLLPAQYLRHLRLDDRERQRQHAIAVGANIDPKRLSFLKHGISAVQSSQRLREVIARFVE